MIRKAASAITISAEIVVKAAAHVGADIPPQRSSTQPTTSGPMKPPVYPSIEWTASVAPRRDGSAVPAVPAVSEAESSQTIGP